MNNAIIAIPILKKKDLWIYAEYDHIEVDSWFVQNFVENDSQIGIALFLSQTKMPFCDLILQFESIGEHIHYKCKGNQIKLPLAFYDKLKNLSNWYISSKGIFQDVR